jgi:hypothetical protein
MSVAPGAIVDPPESSTPQASLLNSAVVIDDDTTSRWEGGFQFQPENCIEAKAWDPCTPHDEDRSKSEYDGNQEIVEFAPYIIEVPYTCSSYGFESIDYAGRAMRALDAGLTKAIEREFWMGEKISTNQSLVGSTPVDNDHILNPGGAVTPPPVTPTQALILLTQALADCGNGSRGMIHATPALVEEWYRLYLIVEADDGTLVTGARRDVIVAGAGYTGYGPTGYGVPLEDEEWAYATGMVEVRIGEKEVLPSDISEAFDRATNTVTYRGEVPAAAYHDGCCSYAVLVDMTGYTVTSA